MSDQATIQSLSARLAEMAAIVAQLATAQATPSPEPVPPRKPTYTCEEVGEILGKKHYTVREWCRLGQCHAHRLPGVRAGKHKQWRIAAEEIDRLQTEGLLPADQMRNLNRTGRR